MRNGCRLAFVEHDGFYDRPSLYVGADGRDYPDNVARYAFLCRAAIALANVLDEAPDIVHCNDWPCCPVTCAPAPSPGRARPSPSTISPTRDTTPPPTSSPRVSAGRGSIPTGWNSTAAST
jgi:hypothetical protein